MKVISTNKKIFKIKMYLEGISPKIWRRILVDSETLLPDFHKIIQSTMGWTNSHLHQFEKNGISYLPKSEDDDFWDERRNVDYSGIKISELLEKEKDEISYIYDFGDFWEHTIILEKIEKNTTDKHIPICLTGKNNCPPEDCGGLPGYYNMLEVLKNPKHEEFENYFEWLDGDFDPKYFDKNEVNELLKMEDFGIIDMLY